MSHKTKRGNISMSKARQPLRKIRAVSRSGLLGLLIIVVIPFAWNIYLQSFTRWRGVGPVKWVGLKNWRRRSPTPAFLDLLRAHSGSFAIVVIDYSRPVHLLSADRCDSESSAAMNPTCVLCSACSCCRSRSRRSSWAGSSAREDGAINALLSKLELGFLQHNWLGGPSVPLPVLMFILVWRNQLGYQVVAHERALSKTRCA